MSTRSSTWRAIDHAAVLLVNTLPTLGVIVAAVLAWRGQWPDPANAIVFLLLWAGTLFGVEGGYHRYFSHRAFKAGPRVEAALAILGSMAFQGPVVSASPLYSRGVGCDCGAPARRAIRIPIFVPRICPREPSVSD